MENIVEHTMLYDFYGELLTDHQKQIYEYVAGDQSVLLLLYGVITIAITVLFIYMWCENLKSGYKAECLSKAGKEINSFGKDVKDETGAI